MRRVRGRNRGRVPRKSGRSCAGDEKSHASASAVAYTMYQKFVNGMPLYRQEQEWRTYGLTLSRATLANWVIRPSEQWFRPLYNVMRRHMLSEPVIHADETEVQVLKEPGREAKAAEASALCYSIIESAKANGLNTYLYLLYILTEMPKAKELNEFVIERCLPWSPSLPEWCRL